MRYHCESVTFAKIKTMVEDRERRRKKTQEKEIDNAKYLEECKVIINLICYWHECENDTSSYGNQINRIL